MPPCSNRSFSDSAKISPWAEPVPPPNASTQRSSGARSILGRYSRRRWLEHVGVAPDLLWLVAELGVGPLAHRAQRTLTETAETHQALGSALAGWQEGSCPACGSWPAFAETIEHARSLRCSFCGRGWSPAVFRCIYCSEADEPFKTGADDPDHPSRRVELCRSCGGYLKNVDAKTRTPFELLPVVDLATSDLDVGAAGRGYTRPSMHDVVAI